MDTINIDSFQVFLDDIDFGQQKYPVRIEDIVVGLHKVFIFDETSAGTTKTVEIKHNQTAKLF